MTPRVTYNIKKDTLKVRIKVDSLPLAIFDTGIYCPPDKFDVKKQISGFPKVQSYMDSTTESIKKLFMPGATPQSIWADLSKQRTEAQGTHHISDAFEYYFKTADVEPSTIKTIEAVKARVKAAGILNSPIKDVNGAMIREFISKLDLKDSTIHETYTKFNSVLNRYIRDQGLDIVLPKGIVKRPAAVESEDAEYLVWDELKDLLRVQVDDDSDRYGKDLWCLMALSGLALSDILLFDPKKNISADGKWIKYNRSKNGSKCIIPLLPQAKEIIDRNNWPAKISKRTLQYKAEGIVSLLVGRKMKTHSARKTAGCIFLEMGMSMESVSKILGHSSVLITQKHYAKITEAKLDRELLEVADKFKV